MTFNLHFQESTAEAFWKEKLLRLIGNCSSVHELRELATYLVKIAATRQSVIKGLIRENLDQMHQQLNEAFIHSKDTSAP